MKIGIKVGEAMTRRPVFANPEDSLIDCAKKMLKARVGALIVKENNCLCGMITEKDIVQRVVAKGLSVDSLKIKDVMTKILITISPEKDIYDAMLEMSRENVRRLPVIENDRLVGLLTEKDILKIQPDLFEMCLNKFEIRETASKPIPEYNEGVCDKCGSYGPLAKRGRKNLCDSCK